MPRRILAALTAALSLIAVTPSRLGSEPATTTTDVFGLRPAARANPLAVYPERPNARYEDIEAPARTAIELGISSLNFVRWSIGRNSSLPGLSVPSNLAVYRRFRFVDGYGRKLTSTSGDILRVVVRMKPSDLSGIITCVGTAADGTVLVPYDRPPPRTTRKPSDHTPFDVNLYLPLGTIRGRVYLTCQNSFGGAPWVNRAARCGASMSERRPGEKSLWPLVLLVIVPIAVIVGLVGLASNIGPFEFDLGFTSSTLAPPPPPSEYGTPKEINTRGDAANPGRLFHGTFPSDSETQERRVGGLPARFSGYTTWVRSVTIVPAAQLVPVYRGRFLRVRATVFNRDVERQHVCSCDFYVWTRGGGIREADAVAAPTLAPDTTMRRGERRGGDVYLYVGTVPGPYFVIYSPDAHVAPHASTARGVWRVPV